MQSPTVQCLQSYLDFANVGCNPMTYPLFQSFESLWKRSGQSAISTDFAALICFVPLGTSATDTCLRFVHSCRYFVDVCIFIYKGDSPLQPLSRARTM